MSNDRRVDVGLPTSYDVVKNWAGMEFKDTRSEEWREYVFKNGDVLHIDNPEWLHIKPKNSHRVVDASGVSHWIWMMDVISIRWKSKPGAAPFLF